jgi:GNAT superfamily N-acetyltransferase
MKFEIIRTALEKILPLRTLFLQENNFQIRYNACHERGWSDSYLITIEENNVGYGSVKGMNNLSDRDTVFEFYLDRPYRKKAAAVFPELVNTSKAEYIECQSNEPLLTSMLYHFAETIKEETVLFADSTETGYSIPGINFRNRENEDNIFEHTIEPAGDYVLEKNGTIIATGGFMLHYNKPFADLYMEVKEDERRKGYGSFLLQELKKKCYEAGRVPAARCNTGNASSKAALLKAGFKKCGAMLSGKIISA